MAHVALRRPDERTTALRETIAEFLMGDESRRRLGAMIFGLDIHYDLGPGHPLIGRRMPDLDLITANGALRVYSLLHNARPVFLNLGEPGDFDITLAPLGGSRSAHRRQLRRRLGAAGHRDGHGSHCGVDSARRICGVGGREEPGRTCQCVDDLVRSAFVDVAQSTTFTHELLAGLTSRHSRS